MKNTLLIITTLLFLFSCRVSKSVESESTSKLETFAKDSLVAKTKEVEKVKQVKKDSVNTATKLVSKDSIAIVKAAKLASIIQNDCDSLGKAKDFEYTQETNGFKQTIVQKNGLLKVYSEQLNDVVSRYKTTNKENTTYIHQIQQKDSIIATLKNREHLKELEHKEALEVSKSLRKVTNIPPLWAYLSILLNIALAYFSLKSPISLLASKLKGFFT